MHARRMSPRLALPLCALALSACLNDSDTLTDAGPDPLPDLAGEPPPVTPTRSAGPSVQGLDRRNWQVVTVAAPRGQVEHQPTYDEPLVMNGNAARNGDAFPTPQSAMDGGAEIDAAAAEGALEAGWPAVMLVLSPFRMVTGEAPWITMQAPQQAAGVLPASQMREMPGLWLWVTPQATRSGAAGR